MPELVARLLARRYAAYHREVVLLTVRYVQAEGPADLAQVDADTAALRARYDAAELEAFDAAEFAGIRVA